MSLRTVAEELAAVRRQLLATQLEYQAMQAVLRLVERRADRQHEALLRRVARLDGGPDNIA